MSMQASLLLAALSTQAAERGVVCAEVREEVVTNTDEDVIQVCVCIYKSPQ